MLWDIAVHSSVSPSARRAALLKALKAQAIPSAFLYETPRQARQWQALHQAWSPARRDAQTEKLYLDAAKSAAERLPSGEAWVIGLGCGDGRKDAFLFEACAGRGLRVHYAPVDVSLPLVLTAAETLASVSPNNSLLLHPLVADLTAAENWRGWRQRLGAWEKPCVITFYGMLPTLSPAHVHTCLKQWVRPGDTLLISANLIPDTDEAEGLRQVLQQYDNLLTRQWLGMFLEDLGVPADSGRIKFSVEQDAGCPGRGKIAADWRFEKSVELRVGGEPILFRPYDSLRLFVSHRYTAGQAMDFLQSFGLEVEASWTEGEEGVFECRAGSGLD